jgi:transcriptional regulator with XRE-family HTH domain
MSIGTKIKKLREFRNYTQEFMADRLQMTQSNYSKIERNEIDVPYSKLEQIATTLDLPIEGLIGFDEKMVFNSHQISGGYNGFNTFNFPEKFEKLYEAQLEAKDKLIVALEAQIEMLKR